MKKQILVLAILIITALGSSESHLIKFCCSDDHFAAFPYLTVQVGDTIEWKGLFSSYPLRSTLVPPGAEGWHITSGFVYRFVAEVPGRYTYECDENTALDLKGSFTVTKPETTAVSLR